MTKQKKKELTGDDLAIVEKETKAITSYAGLSDRQIRIQKLVIRGGTEPVIAKLLGISRASVAKEKAKIRLTNRTKLEALDKEDFMADTISLFEEVEKTAWGVFSESDGASKNRSLQLILDVREKQIKMLMDLGIIERAAQKQDVNLNFNGSPLLENWDVDGRRNFSASIIDAQLTDLEEPEPPEVIDAEFEEEEDKDA